MSTINLNSLPADDVAITTDVWTKSAWADAFVHQPNLMVQETVWSIAPAVSSATLQWRYGTIKRPGTSIASTVSPITTRGYWVLIRHLDRFGVPAWWLGYADSAITIQRYGNDSGGVQEVPCWGMDRSLQYATLTTTVHENPDSEADVKWVRRDQPSFFNPTRPGNRTEEEVVIAGEGESATTRHVFANPGEENPAFWSTREIFKHLVSFHLPTPDYGASVIPFAAHADANNLPNWDSPSLNLDGQTLHSALSELLNADRMLGWCIEPVITTSGFSGTPYVQSIGIRPFTRVSSALALPSIGTLPANLNQVDWYDSTDDLTDSEMQVDDSEAVDQVVVRGPREIGVGTFRYDTEWIKDWVDEDIEPEDEEEETILAEESLYWKGYSDTAGWAALPINRKRELNEHFRALPKMANVFRRYRIKDDWDGTCDGDPVFLDLTDVETPFYVPYLGDTEFLDELPLFRGVDYEGFAYEVDESRGRQRLPMLVYLEQWFDEGQYIAAQDVHTAFGTPAVRNPNRLGYDISVTADNGPGPGFRVSISGAPAHAIGPLGDTFQPNDGDPERINPKIWGSQDIRKALITAAMRGGRRPQYAIPATVTGDMARRRIITLEHPGLQLVEIAAATVVGIDSDGDLLQSNGGTLRNPMPTLQALATIAAKTLVDPRRHISIRTGRFVYGVGLGSIIKTYNDNAANCLVREVRISTPIVESENPPPTTMTIEASTNQVDLVSLVGRVPEPEAYE
jgi:hypothetical protein